MKDKTKSYEIDLIDMAGKVLAEKKTLGCFILVFAIIGIIYALGQQKRYTSSVTLAPEATGMGMSQSISDLAGMVGLDLGGGNNSVDAIYPEIYPEVLASTEFVVNLFDVQVKQKGDSKSKAYIDHIKEDSKIPFYSYPMMWLGKLLESKSDDEDTNAEGGDGKINPFHMNKVQYDMYDAISHSIGCQINKGTNIITISVEDVDPHVAKTIADTVQNRLQEYITIYRTKKARIDLEYAERINNEAELEYKEALDNWAAYTDAHNTTVLASYKARQSALENAMDLKFATLTRTAAQLQQARAKVQERTPAFTIVQRPCIPLRASSTPRSFMVLTFIFLGVMADALWVLFLRDKVKQFMKK